MKSIFCIQRGQKTKKTGLPSTENCSADAHDFILVINSRVLHVRLSLDACIYVSIKSFEQQFRDHFIHLSLCNVELHLLF